MDTLLGETIGRYQVQQLLGQGRLGHVYGGIDVNLERPVALKVLSPTLTSQPDFATRFAQLARLLARLDHPNQVRVYDCGQAGDHHFVAMELLTGPTLAQLLATLRERQQWLTVAEAQHLVRQIGAAVALAQGQGVRPLITPNKIMFRWGAARSDGPPTEYQPVLLDLGLTVLLNGNALSRTLPSQLLSYVAPEMLFRTKGDNRSEIYMLGALFYELALGQPPLQAETVGQAVDAHLHQTIPVPQTLVSDLPAPVADLLQQALAYAPDERYLTVEALLDRLDQLPDLTGFASLPAPATAGSADLVTLYRPGQNGATAGALRASLLPMNSIASRTPAPPPADLALPTLTLAPHLQVIAPDGTMQLIELRTAPLTIGRVLDNDVVLDDPRVSRRHARLEAHDNRWQVVDLQSANGTFLGKQRLPANTGVEWREEQPLQIGNYRLRLVREQVSLIAAPTGGMGRPLPPAQVYLAALRREVERSQIDTSADGSVGLYLVERSGAIDPGSSSAFALILLNQQLVADTFLLTIAGVPSDWVQQAPTRCALQAGEQRQVLLTVAPPRSPQARPGAYRLRLTVASQQASEQQALGEIELTVKPFVRFRAEVQPAIGQVGEALQIQIENQGNATQIFALHWTDEPPSELTFAPAQADLQIPPGQSGGVELSTALRQSRWLGGPREHLLRIQVATHQHTAQHLLVKVISRGRLR